MNKLVSVIKFLLVITIAGLFFGGIYFLIKRDQNKENNLYQISANGTVHWAKEIKILPNGQLEFYDVRRERVITINDKYTVYSPVNK